jgi:hypothetical protein
MRQFHCDQPMEETRIPLKSGRFQIDYLCLNCGQAEREIRSSGGVLWQWINLSVKRRLAGSESASV